MFRAKIKENFISNDNCKDIIDSVKNTNLWTPVPGSSWDRRSIHINTIYSKLDENIFFIIKDATLRIKQIIEDEFDLNKEVYPDTACINRWFPGMHQDPHADDMTNTNIRGFENRVFGSIIYLNVNYGGGHTYYPDYNIYIVPEIGKLAIHPGGVDHIHGVTKIENNIRYTISSFWTYKKDEGIDWELYS